MPEPKCKVPGVRFSEISNPDPSFILLVALVSLFLLVSIFGYAVVRLRPALFMNASATIIDLLLRRAFGQQARPSDPHRTARVRIGSSRLRVLVSRRSSAISRRIVMNNAG